MSRNRLYKSRIILKKDIESFQNYRSRNKEKRHQKFKCFQSVNNIWLSKRNAAVFYVKKRLK